MGRLFVVALLMLAVIGAGCGAAPSTREPAARTAENAPEPPPTSVTAESGRTRARMTYSIPLGAAYFEADLTIDRSGIRVFDGPVEPYSREFSGTRPVSVHGSSPLAVSDLDGDGEPEVLVDLFWGGVHCCWWSRIYHWDPLASRYSSSARLWGNFAYGLEDLDKDGRPEFVSADNRFAYEFTSFAGSSWPIQVLTYRQGKLVDTTRSYPHLIEADAKQQWRWYNDALAEDFREVRGVLAAWAADECLLDRCEKAFVTLRDVSETFADERGFSGSGTEYLQNLRTFLRETGYLPGPERQSSVDAGSSSASRR